ncbi:MAG: M23 family metallopeptidase, partial [Dinghuibacter sp.]|nr:M23 family metallopeptidase [Dinghuibacter sp.]
MQRIILIWALLCAGLPIAAQTFGPYFSWPLDPSARIINSYKDNDPDEVNGKTINGSILRFDHRLKDPANVVCTMGYNCYDGHEGIDLDIGGQSNRPVYAVANGTITCAGYSTGDAALIVVHIKHDNGFETLYWHLSSVAINPATNRQWAVGEAVTERQVIGYTGNTGSHTTGEHLHFGIRKTMSSNNCGWSTNGSISQDYYDPFGVPGKYPSFFKTGLLVNETDIGFVPLRPNSKTISKWEDRNNGYSNNSYAAPTNTTDESQYYAGTWLGNVPRNGLYKVKAYIPSYPNATVQYKIYSTDFSKKVNISNTREINQGNFQNQWADLGTYYFEKDKQTAVFVTNMQGNNNPQNIMAFDAVQWEAVSETVPFAPLPPTNNANYYAQGNQADINPVVPPQRTYVYSAPNYISTYNNPNNITATVPIGSTLVLSAGTEVTLRPGFYVKGT